MAEKLSDKDAESKLKVLDLLTSMAIHDEYQDAVEEGEIVLPEVAEKPAAEKAVELNQLIEPLNLVFEI